MAVIERDVVLQSKDKDGNPTIDLPITRLGNVEDGSEIKQNPNKDDYIPIIDSSDNGQMKKAPLSAIISANIEAHDADANAHPLLREAINELAGRVLAVEVASGAEVTANPFAVTFGNLDGIQMDGVWNQSEGKIEF